MALNKEVWVKQIAENFYPVGSFLSKVTDHSALVENNKIHIASAGIDPEVLINNKTYPIPILEREDKDHEIPLDTFSTENTVVRNAEDIEYAYDKLESVVGQHRSVLTTNAADKAIHAFAPLEDTVNTPIVSTTGTIRRGRKMISFEDILELKERFDDALIPLENRYLVLHPKHVSDLLLSDLKLFKELTDMKDGEPKKFAGFGVYSYSNMPLYRLSSGAYQKTSFKGQANASDSFASVAFYSKEVMKADGTIKMFSREDDPEQRGTVVGFDKRFIAMPIRNKGIGAIVSVNE